jgi:uncharacterized membrane protein
MRPRGLIVALVVSLGLNLFLAGLIVGGVVTARRTAEARPAIGAAPRLALGRAGDDLPRDKRRAFRQALREASRAAQEPIREARGLRREAVAQLERPDFDAAAAIAGMNRARVLDGQGRSAVEAAIMTFAATLTPAERQTLADGLRRTMGGQLRDRPVRAAKRG